MTSAPRSVLLVLLFVLAAGGALFLWLLGGAPAREAASIESASGEPAPREQGILRPSGPDRLVEPPRVLPGTFDGASTTVLWPLRLELELVQADYLPDEPGVTPIGSGSSARLSGRIANASGDGLGAEITFVAGANTGRVLRADSTGAFGATDLFPGLSIVDVRGAGIVGSRREVLLRQNREALLNIGYGRPATVYGRIIDRQGEPIAGALVTLDGTRTQSDPNGDFGLSNVAAGEIVVEVEKQGYALHQEKVKVTGGAVYPRERLTIALEPEAALVISIEQNIGGPGPAQVLLLPGNFDRRERGSTRSARFPWHKIHPIEVFPGTPLELRGLPSEVVRVYAFRPGAVGQERVANLRTGGTFPLEIHLRAAPRITGVVTLNGQTVAGAQVRMEAPNGVRALLGFFREPTYFLETGVLPLIPPAVQEVETDGGGRFVLTSYDEVASVRYLEVRGPGRTWAGRLVRESEAHLEIELQEADLGEGELLIDFRGRHQGLPIELLVDGAPFDPWILPPGEELVVESLLSGLWRVKATWHGQPVFENPRLTLEGRTSLTIDLPPQALEGQDEETWRRAGREYPL